MVVKHGRHTSGHARPGVRYAVLALFSAGAALLGQAATAAKHDSGAVHVEIRNVHLTVERDIGMDIRDLSGWMEPLKPGKPVTFDDPNSFDVRTDSAHVALSTSALAAVLNRYAFAYKGAPIEKVTVELSGARLRIKGVMHKGVVLPFSLEGKPVADANGNIRLHADKFSSAHVPFKGLLHLFGKDLADLVNTNEARGVRIEGDDIVLFPSRLTPPPHIIGKVTAVAIGQDQVIETFGSGRPRNPDLPRRARNYIYHRGGVLRFGKLTMTGADLEIIDLHPADPFDFSLPDYNVQLVAGYSKNTPSYGLIVYMPDRHSVGKRRAK